MTKTNLERCFFKSLLLKMSPFQELLNLKKRLDIGIGKMGQCPLNAVQASTINQRNKNYNKHN